MKRNLLYKAVKYEAYEMVEALISIGIDINET